MFENVSCTEYSTAGLCTTYESLGNIVKRVYIVEHIYAVGKSQALSHVLLW